jgi:hypothetical protein
VTISDSTNKGPLGPSGTTYQVPQFTSYGNTALFGSVANNYEAITEMISNVNSNYNALVGEIQNHSLRSLEFDANFTWSHALDYGQNTDTTSTATNTWYNPYGDAKINYGNSSFNVPDRFVAWALYSVPGTHAGNWTKYLTNGWSLDDTFQMQNGLPYSVSVSGYFSPGILSGWNGGSGEPGGSSALILPMIGFNTQRYPRKIVDDIRAQKEFAFNERYHLQFLANVFNLANHQNIDGLGTTAYKLSGYTATFQPSTYQVPTSSNNSGFLYTPREIEIATRFTF